jgi:predicted tellurium resistance membrane protein TerC
VRDYLLTLALDPGAWLALVTLVGMEIVLGIDNIVFVAILSEQLPYPQSSRARRIGISLSLLFRLMLVASAGFVVKLTAPIFSLFAHEFSWRDIILISGGLFLLWKATVEIHHNVDPNAEPASVKSRFVSFAAIVSQIILIDIVFSIDSIITAVGMTDHVPIMILSVIIAVLAMLIAADPLANFIQSNPTIVMLALSFLVMIGTTLIADGLGFHFPKGYVYTAMAFSAGVEGLNIIARNRRHDRSD